MEDIGILLLATASEREEDYEPFQNPEYIALFNDSIPDGDERSNCSDYDDTDDDDF